MWIFRLILSFKVLSRIFVTGNEQGGLIDPYFNPISSVTGCSGDEFACKDGSQCLPLKWYCDHRADCIDASDEPASCGPVTCSSDQFRCSLTGLCIPQAHECDREVDCGVTVDGRHDTSDEHENCNVTNICPTNHHKCLTTSKCIHLSLYCNNQINCPDGSDEGAFCNNTADTQTLCKYGKGYTADGLFCYCSEGQKYNETLKRCEDENECDRVKDGSTPVCEQICTNRNNSSTHRKGFNCSCVSGYKMVNQSCVAINEPPDLAMSLMVATENEMLHFDQTLGTKFDNLAGWSLRAFDIDHRNKRVCWLDSYDSNHLHLANRILRCASLSSNHKRFQKESQTIQNAEFRLDGVVQISYEWVTGNWYFLDNDFDRVFLCISNLSICKVLYAGKIDKPNDMAIDPSKGYLFATDWGSQRPCVWRLSLDGSDIRALVQGGVIHPYGITLDYATQTVYWLDSYLEYIHSIDYQSNFRRTYVASNYFVKGCLSLSMHNRNLYVSDHHYSRVIIIDKFNGTNVTTTPKNYKLQKITTIRVFHRQRQPDVAHPCGMHNGGCAHICLISYNEGGEGRAVCMCQDGYSLKNGKQCVLEMVEQFLVFGKTYPGTIGAIGLNTNSSTNSYVIPPIRHLQRPTALALKMDTKEVFYSDSNNFSMHRSRLIGEHNDSIVVMDEGLNNCEGLAYDWLSQILYWTDEGFRTVNALSVNNPKLRFKIADTNLSHPRAIAVYPAKGWIFWSDWADTIDMYSTAAKAKIERANSDGSNRMAIVSKMVHWPNGITLHTDATGNKWLYWCDAFLDRIERVDLDGANREVIYRGEAIINPYGLAIVRNNDNTQYLYWSELRLADIRRLHLDSNGKQLQGAAVEIYYNASAPLFELQVFHDQLQSGQSNACDKNNGGCDHFCFFFDDKANCACAMGYDILNDTKCKINESYTPIRHCLPSQFECRRNHRCVDYKYTCDGDDDCGDGTDEDNRIRVNGICANKTCGDGFYTCNDNQCISDVWKCDGEPDCKNGDDEKNCSSKNPCGKNKFHCLKSGRCISNNWLCDHELDCGDGDTSDEHQNCSYPVCSADQFQCLNKQCVSFISVCDGDFDCRDESDELFCHQDCLKGKELRCKDGGACLSSIYKCDGYADCADGEDELNCPDLRGCSSNEFSCSNGLCIRLLFRCDGELDCADGSDEINCTGLLCNKETHMACADNSKCINVHSKCDGFSDCPDNSDELNCGSISLREEKCTPPNWVCHNATALNKGDSFCFPITKMCNGIQECNDPLDEHVSCLEDKCKTLNSHQLCDHFCHNTVHGFQCYCRPGYRLKADMRSCSKEDPCASFGVCSQHCHPSGTHHYCACDQGYSLLKNKFTCKSTATDHPYIIFSNRHELRLLGLRDKSVSSSLVANLKNSIAIDFFYRPNASFVFWTDIAADKIYKGTLQDNTLTGIIAIVEHGISTAEGIAVDWLGQNLFWVDSTLDQIEVANLDGSSRTTVVRGDMHNLRALAVDPRKGLMFWTDWWEMKPRIERCTLAGNDRRELFQVLSVPGGGWPNGLTVDYAKQRLYWIDAKSDSIHTIDYEGGDHQLVLRTNNYLSHPFSISIFEDHVYWTDWRVNSIVRANKWNGTSVKLVQGTSAQPFDLQVLHSSRQPSVSKNPCRDNGGCSHFCLIDFTKPPMNRVCMCPYLTRITNETTCSMVEEAVLFSEPLAIFGVETFSPYNNYMPVVTNKWAENVTHFDVHVKGDLIIWTDSKKNAILKAYLNGSTPEVLVDSDIDHPEGVAIDWLHNNVYFTSWTDGRKHFADRATISIMNMDGAYRRVILSADDGLNKPSKVVLDPLKGKMFWLDYEAAKKEIIIYSAQMDGQNKVLLDFVPPSARTNPRSLFFYHQTQSLYWVNDKKIYWIKLDHSNQLANINIGAEIVPSLISFLDNWLYYFDESNMDYFHIGKIELNADYSASVGGAEIVRNTSAAVSNVKLIASHLQPGDSLCEKNRCPHLCVPVSDAQTVCLCSTGFTYFESNNSCIGVSPFILYADESGIMGRDMQESLSTSILPPISRVNKPVHLDYHSWKGLIFFTDAQTNKVVSINRDLTERHTVLDDDSVKVGSFAIDWIADNIYWTSVSGREDKSAVIEVARLNGSHRSIIVSSQSIIQSIHVDPLQGFLFWRNSSGIQRAYLDGSEISTVVSDSSLTDLTVDLINKRLCWLIASNSTLLCSQYDGRTERIIVHHMPNNISHFQHIALHNNSIYWFDKKMQDGSIVSANFMVDKTVQPRHQLNIINMKSDLAELKIYDTAEQPLSMNNACSTDNGGCQHLCLFRGPNRKRLCKCSFSEVGPDGHSCIDHSAFLAYSQSKSIEFAPVGEEVDANAPYPPFHDHQYVQNVVGLAFDTNSKRLFFSDIQLGHIMAIYYTQKTTEKRKPTIIASDLGSVEGLSFDHIHNDLYWTSYSNGTISRATVSSTTALPVSPIIVLKLGAEDKPRGIALDPCNKRMYWTDWNEATPRIERAYMSGMHRETIISTNIKTPNALAIDFTAKKLYWADARLDKVEMCELDGSGRTILASYHPVSHPFGLVIYGDHLYWTDWLNRAVLRVNKYTGGGLTFIRTHFTRQPMGIVAVAPQPNKCVIDACSKLNLGCQDKCLLTSTGTPFCQCFEGRVLNGDNITCHDPNSHCGPLEFQCSIGVRCISIQSTCDGHNDCALGDDEIEQFCSNRVCPNGYMKCSTGQCIPDSSRCDGINHCGTYEDELDCECDNETQLRCASGMCVDKERQCDFNADCNDASDEMDCPIRNCSAKEVQGERMKNCEGTTQCYVHSWLCDQHNDCWNNFDERDCSIFQDVSVGDCLPSMFKCKSPVHSPVCIHESWVCDHESDCADGSDEMHCPPPKVVQCDSVLEFECEDKSRCIPISWKCDRTAECADGSDERDCSGKMSDLCNEDTNFVCSTSDRCISSLWVCDGTADCPDGSDEFNCSFICTKNQMQCANLKCIPDVFYCDGDDDCGDSSDEPPSCSKKECESDEFECVDNSRCIPTQWKCNLVADCSDKSDEDPFMCHDNVVCKKSDFTCTNSVCLGSEELVCNSENDCGDWSDEIGCDVDECKTHAPCHHICNDKKIGYNCSCFKGYQLASDKHTCIDRDECALDYPCSQMCVNKPGTYQCTCVSGYALQSDKMSCKHVHSVKPYLLVTNRHFLWKYTFDGHWTPLLENLTNAIAIDYDMSSMTAFYSDVTITSSRIATVSLNDTPNSMKVLNLDHLSVRNPDGLAVDWVGRNLYWCDRTTDSIQVSKLDGTFRKTLVKGEPLQDPRAIALDPFKKLVFWTDWSDTPHIGRMEMNGINLKILVNESLKWPNALAVDFITQHIFWGDAGTHIIGMVDYNGKNRRIVKDSGVKHIFSMTLFEDWLFWTDWDEGKVMKCHKHSGLNTTQLVLNLKHRPMGIKVVHPLVQPKPAAFDNACINNGFCSKLCLLTPSVANGHVCECPDDFKLHGALHCVSNCKPSEFVCEHTSKCLPIWWRCDGQNDCGDWQDEMYQKEGACPAYPCTQGQFLCANSSVSNRSFCVHPSKLCDGVNDCPLSDDEGNSTDIIDCRTYECMTSQYKCSNSSLCVNKVQKCDGIKDCPNGDDEINCPVKECPVATNFRCNESSRCIPLVWICDGHSDCPMGDDEKQNCSGRVCNDKQLQCKSTGRCMPADWHCDGEEDCQDGEDERDCDVMEKIACSNQHFTCTSDSKCISLRYRCNGERDCVDGSDEVDCEGQGCNGDEFECADGLRCIANTVACDLMPDCLDASDEHPINVHCPLPEDTSCESNEWRCNVSGTCIPLAWRCDQSPDCPDLSDEIGCDEHKACELSGHFRCKSDLCIDNKYLCDQVPDCGLNDTSDEDPAFCKLRACPPSHLKCADGTCYPSHLMCDGVPQCKDATDEDKHMCAHKCELLCQNGRCIKKEYKCNGMDDCGDNTDEQGCATDICHVFGLCSRWCMHMTGTHKAYKCYCGDGYEQESWIKPKPCKAKGDTIMQGPLLILAGKEEIRFINPTTKSHYSTIHLEGASINSMDFLRHDDDILLYWTDGRKGEIESMKLPTGSIPGRPKRNAVEDKMSLGDNQPTQISTIVSGLKQPHGIAVDWNNRNIYVADSIDQSIVVVRLDGNIKRRLVHQNLYKPQAVAVDPYHQMVFWSDVGRIAKIESCDLNGQNRRTLVILDIFYPSDITVDSANGRLYWADARAGTIETITIYGTDRRLIKSYGFLPGGKLQDRPYHIDVFEDSVYLGGMPYFSSWKESKWGNTTSRVSLSPLTLPLPHAPVALVVHPSKQYAVVSACQDETLKCFQSAMCIPRSVETQKDDGGKVDCICRTGLVYNTSAKTCVLSSTTLPECSIDCGDHGKCRRSSLNVHEDTCLCDPGFSGQLCQIEDCFNLCLNGGTCAHDVQRGIATCECAKEFDGPRCERYKCTNRCEHGICYIETESGYPQCQCEIGYSGNKCSLSHDLCGKCYNGGVCVERFGNVSMCDCAPGFSGIHCQNCYDVTRQQVTQPCHNGGWCNNEICNCPPGYVSDDCSVDMCTTYCHNGGMCEHTSKGMVCNCPVAFEGARCERDLCYKYCFNGGRCKHTDFGKQTSGIDFFGSPQCYCTPEFKGDRCQVAQTPEEYCGPNGQSVDASYKCSCVDDYTGARCDMPSRCQHFCDNGSNCTLDMFGDPQCNCSPGLGGNRCNKVIAGNCQELLCYNDGNCYIQLSSMEPACRCVTGWTGHVCRVSTCNQYCMNGGRCARDSYSALPWCSCSTKWKGDRCTIPNLTFVPPTNYSQTVTSVVIPLVVIVILAFALFYVIFVRTKRVSNQFKHSRMTDAEDEMFNPVFMHGEDDEEITNESTNFTNPMYDNVYQDTVISGSSSEPEHQVLLHNATLQMQPEEA